MDPDPGKIPVLVCEMSSMPGYDRDRAWFRSVAASFHALVAKWMLWLSCTC